jgi:hypothetical protein
MKSERLPPMTDEQVNEMRNSNRKILLDSMGLSEGGEPWWKAGGELRDYVTNDFMFGLPFAPKGMPTMYDKDQFRELVSFLDKSTKTFDIMYWKINNLKDPRQFWFEYFGDGVVSWAEGIDRHYEQVELTYIEFDNTGKLRRYVEHFDRLRIDKATGIFVPDEVDYNADRLRNGLSKHPVNNELLKESTVKAYTRRRKAADEAIAVSVRDYSAAACEINRNRNRRLVKQYLGLEGRLPWWKEGSVEAGYFADDFRLEYPNPVPGYYGLLMGDDFLLWKEYLNRTIMYLNAECIKIFDTPDPQVFWVEYLEKGFTTWGKGGAYEAFKIALLELDFDGRVKLLRDQYSPATVLNAMGLWEEPGQSYNDHRVANGLPPIDELLLPTLSDYLARRREENEESE